MGLLAEIWYCNRKYEIIVGIARRWVHCSRLSLLFTIQIAPGDGRLLSSRVLIHSECMVCWTILTNCDESLLNWFVYDFEVTYFTHILGMNLKPQRFRRVCRCCPKAVAELFLSAALVALRVQFFVWKFQSKLGLEILIRNLRNPIRPVVVILCYRQPERIRQICSHCSFIAVPDSNALYLFCGQIEFKDQTWMLTNTESSSISPTEFICAEIKCQRVGKFYP